MELKNKRIVIGITSAFYAIEKVIPQIEELINNGADIIPVMSFNCYNLDFKGLSKQIENITGKKIIHTIEDAEPIGHRISTDIMAIIPCTGNTIGKLANGIIDTPVLVSAKTNLKSGNNLVIGVATNDGLSIEAENIGKLLKQKNVFFRNVKTNEKISINVASFEFIKYIGRIYNIYDLYKKIYKNEELDNLEKNSSSSF